jgi:hypothetical protein
MRTGSWLGLLARNGLRIHPAKYAMTVLVSGCSAFNSAAAALQFAALRNRIASTRLTAPPVFIVGHWRSGTTLMHELMSLDPRWASPDNYDAFVPHHGLLTGWALKGLVNGLLPNRRPMDDMKFDRRSPQEDDFALISLGAPKPYFDIAFCRDRKVPSPLLALDQCPAAAQQQTRTALEYFYRMLTRQYGRQLMLKSPPHTGRIGLLAEWFPGAKFIHLSRNPAALVASTMKLWRALDWTQSLQRLRYSDAQLQDYIHAASALMYGAYFRQRSTLRPGDLAEISFEQLVADPAATVQQACATLGLACPPGHIDAVRAYMQARNGHRVGQSSLEVSAPRELPAAWKAYEHAFGFGSAGGKSGEADAVRNPR